MEKEETEKLMSELNQMLEDEVNELATEFVSKYDDIITQAQKHGYDTDTIIITLIATAFKAFAGEDEIPEMLLVAATAEADRKIKSRKANQA